MLDATGLIEKHKGKGVLVDTSLLVLYLVGTVNRRRILDFKRTGDFALEDFDLLVDLIAWFGPLFATPHVLAQVSDLTDLSGAELVAVREALRLLVEKLDERYDAGRVIVQHAAFQRLGLTDAAIAVASARGMLVLTADLGLALTLDQHNVDALNFNHVRAMGWRGVFEPATRRR